MVENHPIAGHKRMSDKSDGVHSFLYFMILLDPLIYDMVYSGVR